MNKLAALLPKLGPSPGTAVKLAVKARGLPAQGTARLPVPTASNLPRPQAKLSLATTDQLRNRLRPRVSLWG